MRNLGCFRATIVATIWQKSRPASYGGTQAIAQAMGARDLGLGAGALAALMSGRDARDWVAAGAFCDLADLVATLFARHRGRYGSPRIAADCRELGWRVSQNTVAALPCASMSTFG